MYYYFYNNDKKEIIFMRLPRAIPDNFSKIAANSNDQHLFYVFYIFISFNNLFNQSMAKHVFII